MRKIIGKILLMAAAVLTGVGTSSCIFEYPDDPSYKKGDGVLMILNIQPVASSATTVGTDHEKVKSLRVIMLSNGGLEVNQRYDYDPKLATAFGVTYTYTTVAGEKEIYLIANEDQITGYSFTDNADLPSNPSSNLKDLLNSIAVEESGTSSNGKRMRAVLESLYFPPTYEPDGNGDYYLPYVSYYSGFNVLDNDSRYYDNPIQMYLVPVATKFYFNFTNNRKHAVELNNVEIKKFDNLNFLMAKVENDELYKDFDGQSLYWIDWLAKISELSHQYPEFGDNINFNNIYGWLTGYSMPAATEPSAKSFLSTTVTIPAAVTEDDDDEEGGFTVVTPGKHSIGPFYMPESWNKYTYYDTLLEEELTIQQYTLTLGLHDVSTDGLKDPLFNDIPIDNLKSLFRNTHVIINVTLNEGDLEIYAELTAWDVHHSQGYVIETKP